MFTLNCKGRLLVIDKPIIMGIINTTPDSFYSGSRQQGTDAVLRQAEQMINEGAVILDIGGQSTRPGSRQLSAEEEAERVLIPLENLHRHFPETYLSVDTFYAKVATEAVAAGASIINDISAGSMDEGMLPAVNSLGVPYVLLHMKGTPATMQLQTQYDNVVKEVLDFLIRKVAELHRMGIKDIIVDPGFGFGKSIGHNFQLLKHLSVFTMLDCPLLLGISRKSTVSKTLDVPVDEALNGTTVLHTIGLMNKASILRVHDVKEAKQAIQLVDAYRQA
ncbi:MAG: dihydropteroate synthase [Chitinophagaceae bacterium]